MRTKFSGEIIKGKLKLDDQYYFNQHIKLLDGKRVILTLDKYVKPRSDNQNRYLWGVVYKILGEELGYLPEEIHDAMKLKFLIVHGNKIATLKSTTELSTKEFEEYVFNIRQWASMELQINIPEPNEIDFEY